MARRCKKRKTVASSEPRRVVHDLPDDLLRLILLRLDSPLWLLRAACACKRCRRIVAGGDRGRAFLRLARSLHPPVVVGDYRNILYVGHRFVPSLPTPPVRPYDLEQRHRTCGIDHWWRVADCHGGLVLLREGFGGVSDLVVCDPLSRRRRDIHHPSIQPSRPIKTCKARVYLLDGGDNDGNISISNFRLLYCVANSSDEQDHHDRVFHSRVYVFSTADGGDWRLVRQASDADLYLRYSGNVIGRIDRCLYMAIGDSVQVVDNANPTLEVSEVDLPIRARNSSLLYDDSSTFAVVHGTSPEPTASPATASIVHVCGEELELFRRIPSSGEWVLVHSIPRLSEATRGLPGYDHLSRWDLVHVDGGIRLAMLRVHLSSYRCWRLSLDVDTMKLQVVPDALMWPVPLVRGREYTR